MKSEEERLDKLASLHVRKESFKKIHLTV